MPSQDPIVLDGLRLDSLTRLLSERVTPALVTRRAFYPRPAPSQNTDGGGGSAPMSLYQRGLPTNESSSVPFVLTTSRQNTTGQDTKPAYICHSIDGLALLMDLDTHHLGVAYRVVSIATSKTPRTTTSAHIAYRNVARNPSRRGSFIAKTT